MKEKIINNTNLYLPEIDLKTDRVTRLFNKPILLTFSFLLLLLICCMILTMNVRIVENIKINGIIETSKEESNYSHLVTFINEDDKNKIIQGMRVKLIILFAGNEEKLYYGSISSINLAKSDSNSKSFKSYKTVILFDDNTLIRNTLKINIQVTGQIITRDESLFLNIIKQFKNFFNLF